MLADRQTDTQTHRRIDRRVDHNIPHPNLGGVKTGCTGNTQIGDCYHYYYCITSVLLMISVLANYYLSHDKFLNLLGHWDLFRFFMLVS